MAEILYLDFSDATPEERQAVVKFTEPGGPDHVLHASVVGPSLVPIGESGRAALRMDMHGDMLELADVEISPYPPTYTLPAAGSVRAIVAMPELDTPAGITDFTIGTGVQLRFELDTVSGEQYIQAIWGVATVATAIFTTPLQGWISFCAVWDQSVNKADLYINGELHDPGTRTVDLSPRLITLANSEVLDVDVDRLVGPAPLLAEWSLDDAMMSPSDVTDYHDAMVTDFTFEVPTEGVPIQPMMLSWDPPTEAITGYVARVMLDDGTTADVTIPPDVTEFVPQTVVTNIAFNGLILFYVVNSSGWSTPVEVTY